MIWVISVQNQNPKNFHRRRWFGDFFFCDDISHPRKYKQTNDQSLKENAQNKSIQTYRAVRWPSGYSFSAVVRCPRFESHLRCSSVDNVFIIYKPIRVILVAQLVEQSLLSQRSAVWSLNLTTIFTLNWFLPNIRLLNKRLIIIRKAYPKHTHIKSIQKSIQKR